MDVVLDKAQVLEQHEVHHIHHMGEGDMGMHRDMVHIILILDQDHEHY